MNISNSRLETAEWWANWHNTHNKRRWTLLWMLSASHRRYTRENMDFAERQIDLALTA